MDITSEYAELQRRLITMSSKEPANFEEFNALRLEIDTIQAKMSILQMRQVVDKIVPEGKEDSSEPLPLGGEV